MDIRPPLAATTGQDARSTILPPLTREAWTPALVGMMTTAASIRQTSRC